ncbi:hypothetical protein TNCV_2067281 [Trichonephila clavipes]|uniref:Uncharacterized protein n=1 Tax=Trichonephila clavipes TaxID=2585209 RepID=A0A8X7BE41_TRICX|nr:hypothetical protein TNCV_2067281 [Trichonephila clavipes]
MAIGNGPSNFNLGRQPTSTLELAPSSPNFHTTPKPESGLLVTESISNKWYCRQEGRPGSSQRIDICARSLLDIKRLTTYVDIDSSSCLWPCYYVWKKNFGTNSLQPLHRLTFKPGVQSGASL